VEEPGPVIPSEREGSRFEVFQNQEQIPRSLRSLGMTEKIVSSRGRFYGRGISGWGTSESNTRFPPSGDAPRSSPKPLLGMTARAISSPSGARSGSGTALRRKSFCLVMC